MADQIGPFAAPATSPLVGREREQVILREALAATIAGRGSLVLVGGEAGIGKTALAERLLAKANAHGALVLAGRCYDLSETPPYGPWIEALARSPHADGLPVPPDLAWGGAASQAALFGQVRDYLAALAAQRPVVLVFDDIHWADLASLDLLRFLGRQAAELPLLLLITYRADELTHRHPLYQLLPMLVREAHPVRLDLHPLVLDDLRVLVRTRYPLPDGEAERLAAYLHGRAEGNPFYTGELLRTLEEAAVLHRDEAHWRMGDPATVRVPPLLRQVIDARVARLGTGARDLLAVASVLGHEITPDLWAAISEADEDALFALAELALEARLLAEAEDRAELRFAHALVREALYEGTPVLRRQRLHRQAGEALVGLPHPDPDTVAHHFQRAGDPRAFEWLIRAGLRAYHAVAWLTAVERFVAAAALPDETGARVRARGWLLFVSARLLIYSDNARALRLLDEAEPLALAADDRPLAAHIRHTHGNLLAVRGEIRRGLAAMEREVIALEALTSEYRMPTVLRVAVATISALIANGKPEELVPTPAPTGPTLSPYRGQLVVWFGHTGRYREALAMGEDLIAALASPDSGHPERLANAYLGLGHVYAALARPATAREAFARSREGQYAVNNAHMIAFTTWCELQLAILPYQTDDVAERARLAAKSALARERAKGTMTETAHADPVDLLLALLEGRWTEAERVVRDTLDAAVAGYAHGAIVALGMLARDRGNPDVAWARVREILPAGPATEPGDCYFHHGIALQALAARLALDSGDAATATRWIAAHGRWLEWSGAVLWRADHELLRARLAQSSGEPAAARTHAEQALADASEPRQPLALLATQRLLGALNMADGRYAEATAHLDAALALADACAAPYERALTLLALAELRLATDDHVGALAALDAARVILVPLEARPALARADHLAERVAEPSPPAAVALPGGLSPREAEVLRLLAAGRSTQQIAEALFLSPRTVKRHIANLYLKIDAHGRAEATAYALRHHLA